MACNGIALPEDSAFLAELARFRDNSSPPLLAVVVHCTKVCRLMAEGGTADNELRGRGCTFGKIFPPYTKNENEWTSLKFL